MTNNYSIKKYYQLSWVRKTLIDFQENVAQPLIILEEDQELRDFLVNRQKLVITDLFIKSLQNYQQFYLSGGAYQPISKKKPNSNFYYQARNLLGLLAITISPDHYFHNVSENTQKQFLEEKLKSISPLLLEISLVTKDMITPLSLVGSSRIKNLT